MEYEKINLLKQSEKSEIYSVYEKDSEQIFIQKILKGRQNIYSILQNNPHPYLPKLYEVNISDETTIIIEEYIEGQSLSNAELSKKQLLRAIKELCSVLEFLHKKGIIHRDIKPSNILLAKDGHIRLIDFDAARMPKDDLEQDTRLLGTRGYAPPEQYGFSQTDVRTDIYALGITLKQLLGNKANKLHYKRIIKKCTNLNPDKRYQSAQQVKRAFSYTKHYILCSCATILLVILFWNVAFPHFMKQKEEQSENTNLIVLPVPENPHWDGETGIALWGNVPNSGVGDEVRYRWRLYKSNTATPPNLDESTWYQQDDVRGNINSGGDVYSEDTIYEVNLVTELYENGFYYFAVSAVGDGIHYADSPYVISDAFEYTGENAPPLPTPTGLAWKVFDNTLGRQYYATWNNLDDYEDTDSFNVCVYNKSGEVITNNIWTKDMITYIGYDGIWIRSELLSEIDGVYRFTVQAITSRPNEYQSSIMPNPVPEEYFSPCYYLTAGWPSVSPAKQ